MALATSYLDKVVVVVVTTMSPKKKPIFIMKLKRYQKHKVFFENAICLQELSAKKEEKKGFSLCPFCDVRITGRRKKWKRIHGPFPHAPRGKASPNHR